MKAHLHDEQFDGHPHAWCGRGDATALVTTEINMCTHTRQEVIDNGYEDWDGVWQSRPKRVEEPTTVDIDLHRYKCTQCGKVMYYSQSARDHYEKGIPSPWVAMTAN